MKKPSGLEWPKAPAATDQPRTPESYKEAEWRNLLPVDPETNRVGIGFAMMDGDISRISISAKDASSLAESILYYLNSHLPKEPNDQSTPLMYIYPDAESANEATRKGTHEKAAASTGF